MLFSKKIVKSVGVTDASHCAQSERIGHGDGCRIAANRLSMQTNAVLLTTSGRHRMLNAVLRIFKKRFKPFPRLANRSENALKTKGEGS